MHAVTWPGQATVPRGLRARIGFTMVPYKRSGDSPFECTGGRYPESGDTVVAVAARSATVNVSNVFAPGVTDVERMTDKPQRQAVAWVLSE